MEHSKEYLVGRVTAWAEFMQKELDEYIELKQEEDITFCVEELGWCVKVMGRIYESTCTDEDRDHIDLVVSDLAGREGNKKLEYRVILYVPMDMAEEIVHNELRCVVGDICHAVTIIPTKIGEDK